MAFIIDSLVNGRSMDQAKMARRAAPAKKSKNISKVIGFRADVELLEKFQKALSILGINQSELAREAFVVGLGPAVQNIADRQRLEAVQTLKRLKIAKACCSP
jgi:hypothetical protein